MHYQRRPASRASNQTLIPPALPKGLVGLDHTG
jgi:hypothetical protein